MPTQAERTKATRNALIDAGRELFAERGYAGVSVDELVERAGVTTGALYHHFESKEGLFLAVYRRLVRGIAGQVLEARAERASVDLWSDCESYLDACVDPTFQRIALREAPAVLGWDGLRDGALTLVQSGLNEGQQRGEIVDGPVEPLARMLVAALKEAGVMIATARDPAAARHEAGEGLRALFEGLRTSDRGG